MSSGSGIGPFSKKKDDTEDLDLEAQLALMSGGAAEAGDDDAGTFYSSTLSLFVRRECCTS
jgi:hypothetical protein